MYGSIARLQVKPGLLEKLQEWGGARDAETIPGYVSQAVLQMDANAHELYVVVIFKDKASYVANAQSQAQQARYLEMREMLAADPEWHDGEVIYAHQAVGPNA